MSIRVHKKTRFTTISNDLINNKAVSWEARMVMIYLLSKPEGWIIRSSDLVNQSPAGRDKVASILKELGENQYLYRWAEKVDRGRFEWRSEVFESPDDMAEWVKEQGGLPISHHHNGKTVNGESASLHNGKTVNGPAVNGPSVNGEGVPLVNLDLVNPDLTKTKLIKTDLEKIDPECAIEIKACQVEIVQEEEQPEAPHPLALDQAGNTPTVNGLKKGEDKYSAPGRAALASSVAAEMTVKADTTTIVCDDMGYNGFNGFRDKYQLLATSVRRKFGCMDEAKAAWKAAWKGFEPPEDFWKGLDCYYEQQQDEYLRKGECWMVGAKRFLDPEERHWEAAITSHQVNQQAEAFGVDMGGNGYVGFKRKYEGLCETVEGTYGFETKVKNAWDITWQGFEPPETFWNGLNLYCRQQIKKFQRDGKAYVFGAVRFLSDKTWESAIRINDTQQQALKCGVDITDPEAVKAAARYSSMMNASAIVEQRIAERMRLKNA